MAGLPRWPIRSLVLTGAGLVLMAGATWWLLAKTGADDGAGLANVLALPFGVIGAVAAVMGLRSAGPVEETSAVARRLLTAVTTAEATTLARLLGDTGAPRPADTPFQQPPAAAVHWRTDGGATDGTLSTIADYYQSLTMGRLVVLGEAGAGKTVLVLQLLLDLAVRAQATLDGAEHARVRIPVRLSMPTFPAPDEDADPQTVRRQLDAWVADHLTAVRDIPRRQAKALVSGGQLLLILDGLDEMDPDQDISRRARQVLDALNQPQGPAPVPVVLTCRTTFYRRLTDPSPVPGVPHRPLQDATTIVMQPLMPDQVITWLAYRFPDFSQPDSIQKRWRPVVAVLRNRPRGRLSQCLASPLHLYLATAVYAHPTTTPKDLTHLEPGALKAHLFDRLVPAITANHPTTGNEHHDPAEVTTWLRTLARHLAMMSTLGRSGTDFNLADLWQTIGTPPGVRMHRWAVLSAMSLTAVPLVLAGALEFARRGLDRENPAQVVLLALGALVLLDRLRDFRGPTENVYKNLDVKYIRTRVARRRMRRSFRSAAAIGAVGALVLWFLPSRYDSSPIRLAALLAVLMLLSSLLFGVLGVLFDWLLLAELRAPARPSDVLSRHVAWTIVVVVSLACLFSLLLALVTDWRVAVVAGVAMGLTRAFLGVRPPSGWSDALDRFKKRIRWPSGSDSGGRIMYGSGLLLPRYALAYLVLRRQGRLPSRPGRFLDWAYGAGLVRISGTAVQFRHRDLQAWLIAADRA
ncbi:NACHT domain-containing protein [Actinosynnema sp. NPDC023794]